MPGFRTMPVHEVFISCGDEVNGLRTIAQATATVLMPQLLRRLGVQVAIQNWDFRREPGEVVAAGEFARRSLDHARSSHMAVGIFGDQVPLPRISREEMEELYGRVAAGEEVDIALFFKAPVSDVHRDWHATLESIAGCKIIYVTYADEADFRERVLAELVIMLFATHFTPKLLRD